MASMATTRILVAAIGSYGDVLPLVALALALQQRGYEIRFFSNGYFSELVQQAGINFVSLGPAKEYEDIANHPDIWNPYKGWQLIGTRLVDSLREAYHSLITYLVPKQTILVSSTLGFACRLLQETHGIPAATVHLSPGVFHSAYETPKAPGLLIPDWLPVFAKRTIWTVVDRMMVDPVVQPKLNRFRQEFGLSPAARIFHEWLHSPDLVLCLFPDWFAAQQPDWPPQTHVTGFPMYDAVNDNPLPNEVQKFLDAGEPPVVFTPGSANKQAPRFFEVAITACDLSNHRGIFLTQYPEQLPPQLPGTIKHFSYVPLSQLLKKCALLIHHGGIGTCAQALRVGIPQIIHPLNFDQFDNADRITRLGVGISIPPRSFRAPHLSQKIQLLLSSKTVNTQCDIVRQHFVGNHPLEACCNLIESTLIQKLTHKTFN